MKMAQFINGANVPGVTVARCDWMRDTAHTIGDRKLRAIALPATHASASSRVNRKKQNTLKGNSANWLLKVPVVGAAAGSLYERISKRQDRSVLEQLELGVRYLDIRVCRGQSGELMTVNDFESDRFEDVLVQIDEFLEAHNKEIVMIELVPVQMPDAGFPAIIDAVREHLSKHLCPAHMGLDVTVRALQENNQRLIVMFDGKEDLEREMPKDDLADIWDIETGVASQRSETTSIPAWEEEQKTLVDHHQAADRQQFWMIKAVLKPNLKAVFKDLAKQVNQTVVDRLLEWVPSEGLPEDPKHANPSPINLVQVDFVTPLLVDTCIAINAGPTPWEKFQALHRST